MRLKPGRPAAPQMPWRTSPPTASSRSSRGNSSSSRHSSQQQDQPQQQGAAAAQQGQQDRSRPSRCPCPRVSGAPPASLASAAVQARPPSLLAADKQVFALSTPAFAASKCALSGVSALFHCTPTHCPYTHLRVPAAGDAQQPQPMALSPVEEEPSPSGQGGVLSPGWGLHDNLDVIACRADLLYHRWDVFFSVFVSMAMLHHGCSLPSGRHCLPRRPAV